MSDHLGEHDPWVTLALAIIYQAVLDVQNGHPALANEAKRWLERDGISWCQILDVSENILETWRGSEYKLTEYCHRNWRY